MGDYIRLAEAPQWCIQYPTCSACSVDLDTDGDGWLCPVCGTLWSMDASDGDTGELYADWSGEDHGGPVLTESQASAEGHYRERLRMHEAFPDLVAKPIPPAHLRAGVA